MTVSWADAPVQTTPQLSLRVACAQGEKAASFIAAQYATYPFRLSGNLRLDLGDPQRVYAYVMNASPGILAGDNLRLAVEVGDRASLYLTDQSATKVHSRPANGATARLTYSIQVGAGAYLEYVPEPVILFAAAALTQQMQITLHPQGRLVLSEIVVPGRLAKGEFYQFEQFQSRLQVQTSEGKRCFTDNFRLFGQTNRFQHHLFVTKWPVMGNFVIIAPGVALDDLSQALQSCPISIDELQVGDSPLPGCHGLLVRAIATRVSLLNDYQRHLINCVRQLSRQPPLPAVPK
ncbi:MAG: urease accessory protein UreD [Phormidesmis sp.]